jgi:hypothetical protein
MLVPATGFSKATFLWTGSLFGIGLPLMAANAGVVIWRAESIAGERPYCIEFASQTDVFAYEPVKTLFDLTALKMQARLVFGQTGTLFTNQHHAILAIQGERTTFLNWSYWQENFLEEVKNRNWYDEPGKRYLNPGVRCRFETHFARRLPLRSIL